MSLLALLQTFSVELKAERILPFADGAILSKSRAVHDERDMVVGGVECRS